MKRLLDSTLSSKLILLSVAAFLAIGLLGGIGFTTAGELSQQTAEQEKFTAAVRASGTADMMHDALHADVLSAIVASSPSQVEAAHESATENADGMKEQLIDNEEIRLTETISDSLDEVEPEVEHYTSLALQVTSTAKSDRERALSLLPQFNVQFEELVEMLEANSTLIEEEGTALSKRSAESAERARLELIGVALLAILAFGVTSRSIVRRVVRQVTAEQKKMSSGSERLATMSRNVGTQVTEAQQEAVSLVARSEQMNGNVTTVASAVDEMSASISEISTSASHAAVIVGEAMKAMSTTIQVVGQLGDSSREIGKVVDVITSIAEQTNLLALNATIEAARAGEAGKGFAVVANEVKELANATARATSEIADRIEAIQNDTGHAVGAIDEIASVMTQINDFQGTIASAVEEQTATTSEIAHSLSGVARLMEDSLHGIQRVSAATDQAALIAEESHQIASTLSA